MTKEAKKKASKKAPAKKAVAKSKKESTGKGGRTSAFSGKKITKLVKENPRRVGTNGHNSFSLISNGMSYEKFIEAGGRLVDLKYDVEHGYVKVA